MCFMSKHPSQWTLELPFPSSIFLPEEKGRDCFLMGFLGQICKKFAEFFKAFFVVGRLPQLNQTCVPKDFFPSFCCNILNDAF